MRSCLRLKEMREACGVSLEDIAKKLKMSKTHIEALEDCRTSELPFAPIYRKKLVKQYCEMLHIESDQIVNQFIEEELEPLLTEAPPSSQKTSVSHSYNLPLLFRIGGTLMLGLLFFGYLGLQVKKIVDPPELNLFSPMNGFITQESNLQIKGQTDKEVKVSINGKEIKNSEQGVFDEKLILSPGVNTLVIAAQKKHGKTTTETRYVIFEQKPEFSLTEANSNPN